MMLLPVGGSVYQAGSYLNSGLLADIAPGGLPFTTSYSLSFPTTGDFTYFCLVHGAVMKGVVHVIPTSTPYPFRQKDYNRQARAATRAILRDGHALAATTRETVEHSRTVAMGPDDGVAMVMRFGDGRQGQGRRRRRRRRLTASSRPPAALMSVVAAGSTRRRNGPADPSS